MRRVIALELVGLEKLGCDLYDEKGNVVYNKGTEFTPQLLMKLSHNNVFKRDEEPLKPDEEEEITAQQGDSGDFSEPMPPLDSMEYKSVVDENKKDILVDILKDVLSSVENGTPPNIHRCVEATGIIVDEVREKSNNVSNFGEFRIYDYYTFSHSINVAFLSAVIGRELGFSEGRIKDLVFSALIHDIGKMLIPRNILYKPQSLTAEEMQIIKTHTSLGYDFIINKLNLPDDIAKIALEHHEKWDGSGYPNGLKGNDVSEFSQIVAIADVYDALVSQKIYRSAVPSVEAVRIILTEETKSFNPDIINKFTYMAVLKADKR